MRYLLPLLFLISTNVAAEQVAVIAQGPESVELHDTPVHGLCPKELREAVYKSPQGSVPGCWRFDIDRDAILIVFADGDVFLVPTARFTWKAGKRPAAI